MLAARLDRLPLAEKRLVQAAAVIGTDVPVPLLHAVTEIAEEDLVGSCSTCKQRNSSMRPA